MNGSLTRFQVAFACAIFLPACGGGDDSGASDSTTDGGSGGSGNGSGGNGTGGDGTGGSTGNTTSNGTSNSTSNGDSGGSAGGSNIDNPIEAGSCGLEQPAFCERFEDTAPGGRGGDLDEQVWSYARYGHPAGSNFFVRGPYSTETDLVFPATFCGEPFSNILPGEDVKVCPGIGVDGVASQQLNEVLDDEHDFGFNSMRVRQPFDFTDRVGKIAWDVDAKINPINQGHGWWIEVWVTEDPTPMPYHEAPTVISYPRAGIGFAFQFGADCPETETDWTNALETVTVTKDYEILHSIPAWEFTSNQDIRCFDVKDEVLNHLEIHLTQDRAEFYASDYGDPDSFSLRAVVDGLDLPFSRGYVHFQHAAYNARKDGNVTGAQTFRWDNLGFDGPVHPTPRGYDVPDNDEVDSDGRVVTSYHLSEGQTESFVLENVNLADAESATFNFDTFAEAGQVVEFRFNEGEWLSFEVRAPDGHETRAMRAFTAPVPLDELQDGDNKLEVRFSEQTLEINEMLGNMDLTIEASQ